MSKRNNPYKTSIKNVISILESQDYKCYYCKCNINSKNATCEHIKAYSKVWKQHNLHNIAIACFDCNKLKWDISEELFKDWYICVNHKFEWDSQSKNVAEKVRKPIKWYHGNIIKWNKWNYILSKRINE